MSWKSGTELFEAIWCELRFKIAPCNVVDACAELIRVFEDYDCDSLKGLFRDDWPELEIAYYVVHPKPREEETEVTVEECFDALLMTDACMKRGSRLDVDFPRLKAAVAMWTAEQRRQAHDWAVREMLSASDNEDVRRLPRPPHVLALEESGA